MVSKKTNKSNSSRTKENKNVVKGTTASKDEKSVVNEVNKEGTVVNQTIPANMGDTPVVISVPKTENLQNADGTTNIIINLTQEKKKRTTTSDTTKKKKKKKTRRTKTKKKSHTWIFVLLLLLLVLLCGFLIPYFRSIKDNEPVAYTIKHYKQNLGKWGSEQLTIDDCTVEVENKTSVPNTSVSPNPKFYIGFTAPSVQTVTVDADGTTVIEYFYLRNSFDLTINTSAGTSVSVSGVGYDSETGKAQYGAIITLSEADISVGYSFSYSTDDVTVTNGRFTMPNKAVTITASATVSSYNLTYNTNGGNVIPSRSKSYNSAFTSSELTVPTKTGFEFVGWYNDSDFTTKVEVNNLFTNSKATFTNIATANTTATIYAKWVACVYGDWQNDDNYHWKVCTNCNVDSEHIEHTKIYDSSTDEHWQKCNICDKEFTHSAHDYTNNCDTTCNVCEATRTITHDYQWDYTADKHHQKCSVCDDTTEEENHSYNEGGVCSSCGRSQLEMSYYNLSYHVVGMGDYTGSTPVIPTKYNDGSNGMRNVTTIDYDAFKNNTNITSVTIPSGIQRVGANAFDGTKITSISIPATCTNIHQYAFAHCDKLASVTILGDASIGQYAFTECSDLSSVSMAGSTSLGMCAFSHCTSLTTLSFPYVTSISYNVFYGCKSLTSIELPSTLTDIVENPFRSCSKLEEITVASANTKYKSEDNCVIEIAKNKVVFGCKNSVIPSYITAIGNYAFAGIPITSITYPAGLLSIGKYALWATSITSADLPSGITTIGEGAFYNSNKLTSAVIPSSVTSFGENVFHGCNQLSSVSIQADLTAIKTRTFAYCGNLTSITIPSTVQTIETNAFFRTGLTSLYIPASVTDIAEDAFNACAYLATITVDSGNEVYHSDGNCLIKTSTKVLVKGCKESVIPTDNTVTSIGNCAFYECLTADFQNIVIPSNIKSIGMNAFRACNNLQYIVLPAELESIGAIIFAQCTSLQKIFYMGSSADWDNINIDTTVVGGYTNEILINTTRYYFSSTQPTTTGNYWHYEGGVPTIWSTTTEE